MMIQLIWLLLPTLALTRCSIAPQKASTQSPNALKWQQYERKVRYLDQYQIRGTFVYLSTQQKVYARFYLQQTSPDNYRLLVLNSLGNTEFQLHGRAGQTQVTDKKGKHYITANAEETIGEITGIQIPLNRLREWILGLPGDATDYKLDKHYRLSELNYTKNGKTWKVLYGGYNTKITPALPLRIDLIEEAQRIKLKIDNWIVK